MNNQIEIPCDEEIESFLKEMEGNQISSDVNNPDLEIEKIKDYYTITQDWGEEDEATFCQNLLQEVNTINFLKKFKCAIKPINNITSFNLCSPLIKTFNFKKHTKIRIDTGICIDFPPLIYAKLEISKNLSLLDIFYVGSGIIDSGYRGSLIVCLENLSNNDIKINYGEPIAEMILKKRDEVSVEQEAVPKEESLIAKKRGLIKDASMPLASPSSPADAGLIAATGEVASDASDGDETETAPESSDSSSSSSSSEDEERRNSFRKRRKRIIPRAPAPSPRSSFEEENNSSTDEYENSAQKQTSKSKKPKVEKIEEKVEKVAKEKALHVLYSRASNSSSRLIRNNPEDVCFDVTVPETKTKIELKPGATTKVSTGIFLKLAPNCIAKILDRSSLAAISHIRVVGCSIVQPSQHKFPVVISLRNEGSKPFILYPGRAFAQVLFEKVEPLKLRCVSRQEFQSSTFRGENGFGSTDA